MHQCHPHQVLHIHQRRYNVKQQEQQQQLVVSSSSAEAFGVLDDALSQQVQRRNRPKESDPPGRIGAKHPSQYALETLIAMKNGVEALRSTERALVSSQLMPCEEAAPVRSDDRISTVWAVAAETKAAKTRRDFTPFQMRWWS